MGVDLNYINQKQQELEAAAAARGVGGFRFWNPEAGKSKLRLMPPWAEGVRSFERATMTHWSVGPDGLMFTCPGAGCPICEYVQKLRATGDPADAEKANEMAAKKRYLSNIVDLNDPVYTGKDVEEWQAAKQQSGGTDACPFEVGQTKVQVFGYGAMIYTQLMNIFAQLQQDITDIEHGYDLLLTKVGQKMNTKYTIIPAPPARPMHITGRKSLSEILIDLDKILPPKPIEDMLAALSPQAAPAPAMPAAARPPALPPPAASPAPVSLPPPAPAPAAAGLNYAPKAAPKAAAPAPAPAEPPPPCFKDKTTFDQADAQCAGGEQKDPETDTIEKFEKCPFFQECGEFAGKLVAPTPARRRGRPPASAAPPAPAAASTPDNAEADLLEAQMRSALNT